MINAIVAVGNQGQIGLHGRLPWHDSADLGWFRRLTMNQILIAGYKTYKTLPLLSGRQVFLDPTGIQPDAVASYLGTGSQDLWIIGGAKTFDRWCSFIDRWHIGRVDYDGPSDAIFNVHWILGMPCTEVQL